jgi:hypothetical protein
MSDDYDPEEVAFTVEAAAEFATSLGDLPTRVKGAIITNLLAMWLSGRLGPVEVEERENILTNVMHMVRALVEADDAMRATKQ